MVESLAAGRMQNIFWPCLLSKCSEVSTEMAKKVCPRLSEIATWTEAGSRNLGQTFLAISVQLCSYGYLAGKSDNETRSNNFKNFDVNRGRHNSLVFKKMIQ